MPFAQVVGHDAQHAQQQPGGQRRGDGDGPAAAGERPQVASEQRREDGAECQHRQRPGQAAHGHRDGGQHRGQQQQFEALRPVWTHAQVVVLEAGHQLGVHLDAGQRAVHGRGAQVGQPGRGATQQHHPAFQLARAHAMREHVGRRDVAEATGAGRGARVQRRAVRQRDGPARVHAQRAQGLAVAGGELQPGQARRPARLAAPHHGTQRAHVVPLTPQRERERFVDGAAVAGDQQRGTQLAVGVGQRVDEARARGGAQQRRHRHLDALPRRHRQRACGQHVGLGDRRGRRGRRGRGAARRARFGTVVEVVGQRDGTTCQRLREPCVVVGPRHQRALPARDTRAQGRVVGREAGERRQRVAHGARLVVGLGQHQVDAQRRGMVVVEQRLHQRGKSVARPGPAAEGTQAGVVDIDDDDVVARRRDRRERGGLAEVVERELQARQRGDRRDGHVPGAREPQHGGHEREPDGGMPALDPLQRALPERQRRRRIGVELGGVAGVRRLRGRRVPVGRGGHAATRGVKISSARTASGCRRDR